MYYAQINVDPKNADRIYIGSAFYKVSDDGGKTIRNLGEKDKHVDNHVIWIDPDDTSHYLVGCDGGLYESHDRGENWRWFENLPLGQFYRVSLDNTLPFYRVYGGTQDNSTWGAPSRTKSVNGIANADWEFVNGRRRLRTRRSIPGSEHRLRRVPVRKHRPLRSAHRRIGRHHSCRAEGWTAVSLQLGFADPDLVARSQPRVLRGQRPLPQRRSWRQLASHFSRPDPSDRSQ